MEGREPSFLDEEAAVEQLAKGYFCDKSKYSNDLFEIGEGEQTGLNPP